MKGKIGQIYCADEPGKTHYFSLMHGNIIHDQPAISTIFPCKVFEPKIQDIVVADTEIFVIFDNNKETCTLIYKEKENLFEVKSNPDFVNVAACIRSVVENKLFKERFPLHPTKKIENVANFPQASAPPMPDEKKEAVKKPPIKIVEDDEEEEDYEVMSHSLMVSYDAAMDRLRHAHEEIGNIIKMMHRHMIIAKNGRSFH